MVRKCPGHIKNIHILGLGGIRRTLHLRNRVSSSPESTLYSKQRSSILYRGESLNIIIVEVPAQDCAKITVGFG